MHNNEFYSARMVKRIEIRQFSNEPQPIKAIRHLH